MFIDDFLIYSKSKKDHVVHLKLVMKLLKKEKLFAKFSKCKFWLQEIRFLKHVVNNNGYYWHLIVNFLKIAKPFTSLMQKNQNDYDCEIRYHPRKANVVADALSRKERVKLRQVRAMSMTIQSSFKDKILAAQSEASKVENASAEILRRVRTLIMDETHASRYSVHPGADKTYCDLRDMYWWPCMKKEIPEWKWDRITMDSITKLPRSSSGHDTIWVIVDRVTKSAHVLAIHEDYKIERLARICIDEIIARHGVHVRKALEFEVGDKVLLKVSPWKGEVRFGKKGKLATRYVGPFEILERIGLVAYCLRFLQELNSVHDTFHVLNLKKFLVDANLHVPLEEIKVDKPLCFVEEPVEIMDREVKKLKHSRIPIIKVCWNYKCDHEFTCERVDFIKA
nr:reverse transcriptase domain-containing protein [Tanacetum cinerariifolium]